MTVVTCIKCGAKNRVDPRQAAAHIARCGTRCGKCATPLDLTKAETSGMEGKPLTVTDATFQEQVIKAGSQPVLLDAWAPWCGPCRMIGPIMEQLAAESKGRYRIAKLNVDENPGTAAQFQIQSIPTMLIFKNGKLVDRLVGAQPKPAILARLTQHIG